MRSRVKGLQHQEGGSRWPATFPLQGSRRTEQGEEAPEAGYRLLTETPSPQGTLQGKGPYLRNLCQVLFLWWREEVEFWEGAVSLCCPASKQPGLLTNIVIAPLRLDRLTVFDLKMLQLW